jgi:hypothetical protein
MAGQSKLEQVGIQKRNELIAGNTFNYVSPTNQYSVNHTRALSDDITPVQGKGTGIPLDSTNGGGSYDIHGHPEYPGSGRIHSVSVNEYNSVAAYTAPDMSLNTGQIDI